MKKAFIGKGYGTEYLCFTKYKMINGVAKVHSESNKYDVTHYVNCCIVNWIGERIEKMENKNLSDEEFGKLVGNDFNELVNKLRNEETMHEEEKE